jgi:hypothetical protein
MEIVEGDRPGYTNHYGVVTLVEYLVNPNA